MIGTRIWRFLAVGALVISMFAVNLSPTLACSCGGGGPYGEVAFVGRAMVVFEGDWVRERLRATKRRFASTVALLAVEDVLYGPRRPFFVVAGGYEADCHVLFEPGAAYTIYGREKKRFGPLETTICDGSYRMSEAVTQSAQE